MKKLTQLWHDPRLRELFWYVFFGALTTLVNVVVFQACTQLLHIHYLVANIIAWVLAVAFAYGTNRRFVFRSHTRGAQMAREITLFVGGRLASLGIDEVSMFVLISLLHMPQLLGKLIANVLVVIVNYILSKLVIFRKKRREMIWPR